MASEINLVNWRNNEGTGLDQFRTPDKMICKRCGKEKDKEKFGRSFNCKIGRRGTCLTCEQEKQALRDAEKPKIDTSKYFDF